HWPLPPQPGNYAADRVPRKRTGIQPLEITQPEGPSFQVDGNRVTWQNWSFVVGFNAREGLTLHHLRYNDGGKDRSILYRASLTAGGLLRQHRRELRVRVLLVPLPGREHPVRDQADRHPLARHPAAG